MRDAVGSRFTRLCIAFGTALVILTWFRPQSVLGETGSASSFRSGLCFSEIRPLTAKQLTALLQSLRRWTGFTEMHRDAEGFLVLGNRTRIVGGSPAARALISAAVDGPDRYTIESHHRSPELAFAQVRARLDYVDPKTAPGLRRRLWGVEIDFQDFNELRGQSEVIRAFDPAACVLHEIAHAVMGLRDATSRVDSLGDCERYINQMRRELGLPERQRYEPVNRLEVASYGAQRILGELSFVQTGAEKRTKEYRLAFDVENVSAACLAGRPKLRKLARR